MDSFDRFDPARVPSPCHVLDLARLESNLETLANVRREAGIKVLLALKAFSCFPAAELVGRYLDGCAASGLWEAKLAATRFSGEVHTYAPGLKAGELDEIRVLSDHLIFNSLTQFERFRDALPPAGGPDLGLRINPEHSEVETPLYDPCAAGSRLGVPVSRLAPEDVAPFSGLHVHALCDQMFEPFDRLVTAVETRAAHLFGAVGWLNLGGGQLFTAPDYPIDALVARLLQTRERTGLDLILEPGTAIALDTGVLVAEVLDTGWNRGHFAVMDVSATCHMPDVIEAPYTPDIAGAEIVLPGDVDPDDASTVRLGGPTCLAGDVTGTYRFPQPPQAGDRLMIRDQAYYTMVKATTFNGTPLPSLALWDSRTDALEVVKSFGYAEFEGRLG